MNDEQQAQCRYLRAGWVYLVCGMLVMAVTVLAPGLASPERRGDLVRLFIGLPVFALFAWLIARGDRLLGRGLHEKIVMLLTLTSCGRLFVFTSNALGAKPALSLSPLSFAMEPREPALRMWVNAALMVVIVFFLGRASWGEWWRRRKSPGAS